MVASQERKFYCINIIYFLKQNDLWGLHFNWDNVFSTQINGFSTKLDTGLKKDVFSTKLDTGLKKDVFSTQLNNDLKLFMIWVVKNDFTVLT